MRHLARGLLVMLALAGCGSAAQVSLVNRRAQDDLAAARAARAHVLAPYWFTLATEYLAKAREEAAKADFRAARRLGEKASMAARQAFEAARASGEGAPRR